MSQRHRFINDGRSPIPMGSDAKYACVCGKMGTRDEIEQHVEQHIAQFAAWDAIMSPAAPIAVDLGGETKAHYLPVPPRAPAPSSFTELPTPPELPPPPASADDRCPVCPVGEVLASLPEITAWSCGHWIRRKPQPVAEAFQEMLRGAFQAGVAAAASGESFERWYQREVLR